MKKLILDTTEFDIPENWNEFTREQLMFMANLFLSNPETKVINFKTKLLLFVLDANLYSKLNEKTKLPGYELVAKRKKFPLTADQFSQILSVFDFLFTEPDDNGLSYINPQLTTNHFRTTQCGCRMVYGPDDGLTNIKWDQFAMLQVYQASMDSDIGLNKFMACLFARKNFEPDMQNITANADFFAKLSPTVKLISTWFYHGSMSFIANKFKDVFSPSDEKTTKSPLDQQMYLLHVITKGDPTKNEQVQDAPAFEILYSMQCTFEEDEKLRQQHPELFKK